MSRRVSLIFIFLLVGKAVVFGQYNANEWIANMAQELLEQGGEDLAVAFTEYYQNMLDSPLKINMAAREDLERLVILTDFQIESILDYRNSSGNILSATELSLLNGFDDNIALVLSPFLDFSVNQIEGSSVFGGEKVKKFSHNLFVKSQFSKLKEEVVGEPVFVQIRYKSIYKGRFQVGLTLENDAGEKIIGSNGIPFGDFISMHVSAQDIGWKNFRFKKIVLGDYSAKFGQGLVMWNSFNMQGNNSVAGLYKRGEAISPYTSSTEYGYLRGVATTLSKSIGRNVDYIDLSLFFSYNGVDATVKNGKYTSLTANGLHNTNSSLKRKMAIRECVWGANLKFQFRRFNFGISWAGYGYDTENGVKLYDYNRFQQFYNIHGNIGADFNVLVGGSRLFGEIAFDYSGDFAAVLGAVTRFGEWDWGIIARYYSKGYIAPYSGAYSSQDGTYNQAGIALSVSKYFSNGMQLSMGADGVYYPWYRYNIPWQTWQAKVWVKLENISDTKAWSVKIYNNYTSAKNVNKVGLKGYYKTALLGRWLQVEPKGEIAYSVNLSGYLAANIVSNFYDGKLKFYLSGVYYNCKKYLNRLYMYENDLPMSFNSKLLYGHGFKGYFMAQYKNYKFGSIYLKIDSDLLFKVGLKSQF